MDILYDKLYHAIKLINELINIFFGFPTDGSSDEEEEEEEEEETQPIEVKSKKKVKAVENLKSTEAEAGEFKGYMIFN